MSVSSKSTKAIHILLFYQYFGTPAGGWSTRFYEFGKRWVAAGNKVTIITSPYYKSDIRTDSFISKRELEGMNLIVINAPDSNKSGILKRAANAIIFAFSSIYYALTLPHDVVLGSSGPITVGIPTLTSKFLRRKPMVFEVRDLWPQGGIELGKLNNPILKNSALWFEKFCYTNSQLVVACSEGMEKGIKKVSPEIDTLIIPNSSDVELFSGKIEIPNQFPKELKEIPYMVYIGSLGLMDDCSQIVYGLNAAKELGVDFRMIFIGDGEERYRLEELVDQFGLKDQVKFLGLIPKNEVAKWLKLARASFVTFKDYPVLQTSSPNKMFDSFAAGIPIIQSTQGWIKTLIDRTDAGWNVVASKPETFAKAIQEAIDFPEKASKKGVKAYALAQSDFNRGKLAELYLEKLKGVVS